VSEPTAEVAVAEVPAEPANDATEVLESPATEVTAEPTETPAE
jgi:hypothetical protein